MPKRKRDESVSVLFTRHRTSLFHALKQAKGFERQRQSKRLSDRTTDPAKRSRIENEIVVLKSLDLQQTAHAHLCSSLLKIKGLAEAEGLPEEVREGVARPEVTEEERAALHNVTSSLYNRVEVKRVVEKAVEEVCRALGVEVPRKGGRVRKEKGDKGGKGGNEGAAAASNEGGKGEKQTVGVVDGEEDEGDQRPSKADRRAKDRQPEDNEDSGDEEEEEKAISQLDKLLGLDSDEESDDEEEVLFKGRARKSLGQDLDPMEITTDEEDGDDELDPMEITSDEENDSDDEDEFNGFSDAAEGEQSSASDDEDDDSEAENSDSSASHTPPPKKAKKAKGTLKPTDSTFLPSLMGGYISGSESASDVDVAPPERKNRRGQRARQAIWEKKFGEKAKHLTEPSKGRDAGWDLKRGAVDGKSKPWKQGIRNPLLDKSRGSGANEMELGPKKEPAPRKRDDGGALHPSWEARRLAKAKEQAGAAFQGKKITFD
ncbi:Bud-site selection protein [Dichotomopilus funicola]|uniref:Bud-site selection protein n=1 Tax=Dichotomopilus funicola TaxID=1934379 RepID=A0AAN6V686_9PEZI|nr:Bud-site selection protein [Dichotomopilus funicola]